MPSTPSLSRTEKAKVRECFEIASEHYYRKWTIYDNQGSLHPNSMGLSTVINQPQFHDIRHILVLGLDDPGPIQHGKSEDTPQQQLFFKRLAVIRDLRRVLMPKGGPVHVENENGKFSAGLILGLNHLQITVVNEKHGGFRLATEHSLVYDLRHKQGDLVTHMNTNFQLPAAVLTDVSSLRPSSDNAAAKQNGFSRVRSQYDLISLMGICDHTTSLGAKKLTEARTPFVLARSAADMAAKESQLTENAYAAARAKYAAEIKNWDAAKHKKPRMPNTYVSEPQMILLCRKGLPRFSSTRRAPLFHPDPQVALYHKHPPVKLRPSDFHDEGSAASSTRKA